MGIIVEVTRASEYEAEKRLMGVVNENNLLIKGSPTYSTVFTRDNNALQYSITALCSWRDNSLRTLVEILHPTFPITRFIRQACEVCGYDKTHPNTLDCPVCKGDRVPHGPAKAFAESLQILVDRKDLPPLVREPVTQAHALLPIDTTQDAESLTRSVVSALVVLEDVL